MLIIRRAEIGDSRDLFSWRNDPATREASLNTSEISWDSHVKWYSVALHNPKIILFICEESDQANGSVGMCRFNISENGQSAEVSINLNPKFRGKGLSQSFLHASLEKFTIEFPEIQVLTATIRADNEPSKKIFLAEKFIPEAERTGVIELALSLKG